MSRYLLSFLILFSIGSHMRINATGQEGDLLIIGNDTLTIFTCPIEHNQALSDSIQKRKNKKDFCTSCWRGYIGIWRLEANKLFLEKIRNYSINKPYTYINIDGIFDNYKDEQGRIFASWFTGMLRVVQGECVYYEHMGFNSNYEQEIIYQVKDGIVVNKQKNRNYSKKATLSLIHTSIILCENFNGDLFPELANSKLIAHIRLLPDMNGKIDSLKITLIVDTNKVTQYPIDHPYMKEVLRCIRLIPDWEVNCIYGKIKWHFLNMPFWRGKERKIQLSSGESPDSIYYNDSIFAIRQLPLQSDTKLYTRLRPYLDYKFNYKSRRGYTAIWEVADNHLYLKSIYLSDDSKPFPLNKLFQEFKEGKPVEASWYSGHLQLFYGKSLTEYNNYYPIEIDLKLENGLINGSKRYCNYIIPRDDKAYKVSEMVIKNLNWPTSLRSFRKMISIDYIIIPAPNGIAQDVQIQMYDSAKMSEQEFIEMKKACQDALSKVRWEVIYEREKIIPVKGTIYVNLDKNN